MPGFIGDDRQVKIEINARAVADHCPVWIVRFLPDGIFYKAVRVDFIDIGIRQHDVVEGKYQFVRVPHIHQNSVAGSAELQRFNIQERRNSIPNYYRECCIRTRVLETDEVFERLGFFNVMPRADAFRKTGFVVGIEGADVAQAQLIAAGFVCLVLVGVGQIATVVAVQQHRLRITRTKRITRFLRRPQQQRPVARSGYFLGKNAASRELKIALRYQQRIKTGPYAAPNLPFSRRCHIACTCVFYFQQHRVAHTFHTSVDDRSLPARANHIGENFGLRTVHLAQCRVAGHQDIYVNGAFCVGLYGAQFKNQRIARLCGDGHRRTQYVQVRIEGQFDTRIGGGLCACIAVRHRHFGLETTAQQRHRHIYFELRTKRCGFDGDIFTANVAGTWHGRNRNGQGAGFPEFVGRNGTDLVFAGL